jgi:hypothetical protein
MTFGTFVVTFGFGRVLVPDRFVYRVFEDGCLGMYGVLVLLIDHGMALFTGGVVHGIQCAKKCEKKRKSGEKL